MKIKNFEIIKNETDYESVQIINSLQAEQELRKFYRSDIEIYESFFMLTMNRANRTTGYVKISQGGFFSTVVDIVIVAKYAIESLASSVIICHNHPSGNTLPSEQDLKLTEKIKIALQFFDIKLMEHIILTKNSYYSFLDENKI